MTETEKWDYLVELDETLLMGGVILSEWATFLIRNADLSFVGDANLSCIIKCLAGIETLLRSEEESKRTNLYDLIERVSLDVDLKTELHSLRKCRNKWVHVSDPWNDEALLKQPEKFEEELFDMAKRSLVALRKTIYSNPWI